MYCDPGMQVSTYAVSASDPLIVKNIDCVSLETTNAVVSNLTVGGNPFDSSDFVSIKTTLQNQSATLNPQVTTFTGKVTCDNIDVSSGTLSVPSTSVNTIVPFTAGSTVNINSNVQVNGNVSLTDSLSVINTTGTIGGIIAAFYQSNLASNQSVSMAFGKSSNTNEGAFFRYNNDSAGANLEFGLYGASSSPKIYSTYTNIPLQLRIANTIILPKVNTSTVTLSSNPTASPTIATGFTSVANGLKKITISIVKLRKSTLAAPVISFNSLQATSSIYYRGGTTGNNAAATNGWPITGLRIWNNSTLPADETTPSTKTRYFNAVITLIYAGILNSVETWTVDGRVCDVYEDAGFLTSSDYQAFMTGQVQFVSTTATLSSLVLHRVDTGNWTSGTVTVQYE